MLYPLHAINLNILQVKGRSDLFLKLEILKKAILTILIILVLSFRLGILGLVWTYAFSSYIAFFVNTIYSKELISYSVKDQISDILPSFLLSFSMGLLVFISGELMPGGDLIRLAVQGAVGFIFYIGVSKVFRIKELVELTDLARTFIRRK
jgi:O-antigen/teichoic acid export membrane protein